MIGKRLDNSGYPEQIFVIIYELEQDDIFDKERIDQNLQLFLYVRKVINLFILSHVSIRILLPGCKRKCTLVSFF